MTIPESRLTQLDEYRYAARRSLLSLDAPSVNVGTQSLYPTLAAAGTRTLSGGVESLACTAASGDAASVASARVFRSRRGLTLEMSLALSDAGVAENDRAWGFTSALFVLTGTELKIAIPAMAIFVDRSAWSDQIAGLDLTKLHRYRIDLPPGGMGEIRFSIDGTPVYERTWVGSGLFDFDGSRVVVSNENTGTPASITSIGWGSIEVHEDGEPLARKHFAQGFAPKALTNDVEGLLFALRPATLTRELVPEALHVLSTSVNYGILRVYKNSTAATGTFSTVAGAQTSTDATFAGAARRLVSTKYVLGTADIDLRAALENDPLSRRDQAETADCLEVTYQPITTSSTVTYACEWSEER